MKRPKSLLEQIADLNDPAPRGRYVEFCLYRPQHTDFSPDLDPEDERDPSETSDDSASEASGEARNGREHYEATG